MIELGSKNQVTRSEERGKNGSVCFEKLGTWREVNKAQIVGHLHAVQRAGCTRYRKATEKCAVKSGRRRGAPLEDASNNAGIKPKT